MILIADSGSTKTSWCLLYQREKIWFNTEGYNPYYVNSDYISGSIKRSLPSAILIEKITEVFYYGAGCETDKVPVVQEALEAVFIRARISVESDMLGAARALLVNKKGFAAILGTGTNTCIFDGSDIVSNVNSLGYMLGDEGSGAYLGKKLLRDYIRRRMPGDMHEAFSNEYRITDSEIINNVYTKALPNRYCASFSMFLSAHANNTYIRTLIKRSFRDFFENLVSSYPDYQEYSFNACGSIAYHFKDLLIEVAEDYKMVTGNILVAPIEQLADYHCESFQFQE
jgi:glucosamine kinase